MKSLRRFSLIAVCAISLLALPALAQAPPAAPGGGQARTPMPPPKNLKVFPKDTYHCGPPEDHARIHR